MSPSNHNIRDLLVLKMRLVDITAYPESRQSQTWATLCKQSIDEEVARLGIPQADLADIDAMSYDEMQTLFHQVANPVVPTLTLTEESTAMRQVSAILVRTFFNLNGHTIHTVTLKTADGATLISAITNDHGMPAYTSTANTLAASKGYSISLDVLACMFVVPVTRKLDLVSQV